MKNKLSELLDLLYHYTPNDIEFFNIREEIEHILTDDKYDERVVSFKSRIHPEYDKRNKKLENLNSVFWIDTVEELELFFDYEKTFLEEHDVFEVYSRRQLEYNPICKQLVVCSYFTDGERVLLLKTKPDANTRIKDKYTLIQGHVSQRKEIYTSSQLEYLYDNMLIELEEETNIKQIEDIYNKLVNQCIEPKFLINSSKNLIDIEHFGVVYELFTTKEEFDILLEKLQSNEPENHYIVSLNISDYDNFHSQGIELDNWLDLVLRLLYNLSKSLS